MNARDILLWHYPSAPQDRNDVWSCVDGHSGVAGWPIFPSLQRRRSFFLPSDYCTQKRSVETAIPAMEEEEEEGRALGGGSGGSGTTTTTTTLTTATEIDRIGGGCTHSAGVRRPRSGSTGGCGGEGTTTNSIRLHRRKNSASWRISIMTRSWKPRRSSLIRLVITSIPMLSLLSLRFPLPSRNIVGQGKTTMMLPCLWRSA